MASSMLTGDRRWAPSRKSGMTVLGKVPKPINLPSQRLENQGNDPNVEIVPKGTLTWGSRTSSSTPNAWGSSNHSDRSISSPTTLNGRPSSGGSGTRPSTAGSDKSFEPISNAWTPNSRPSSASGLLVSNQSSLLTRPRSAETRPSSSPLSRFSESIPENSVPWTAGTTGRLGNVSSKDTNFTLSNGDFPTLGSEKNSDHYVQEDAGSHSWHGRPSSASGTATTQRGWLEASPRASHSPQRRPSSSSGTATTQKGWLEVSPRGDEAASKHSDNGTVNNLNRNTLPYIGHWSQDIDKWHRDPQMAHSYPNMNSQHANTWHGPPVHSPPDEAWYRGVGPYRPPGPPGNFRMEPFAYYPQRPPVHANDSQSVPRAGAVLGGYPHKSGMSPDSYVIPTAPVISSRPASYPGPVPYDGYYGTSHPNMEKTTTEMAVGHGVFNQFQHQNVPCAPGNFHGRPSGYVGSGVNQQMDASHHETHGGQYRVLLKQHGESVGNNTPRERREQPLVGGTSHRGANNHPAAAVRNIASVKARNTKKVEVVSSVTSTNDSDSGVQSDTVATLSEISSEAKLMDNSSGKTSNSGTSFTDSQHPVKSSTTSIEKGHGLNNKIVSSFSEKGTYSRRSKNDKIEVKKFTGFENSHLSVENGANSTAPNSHVALETSLKAKNMPQLSEDHPFTSSEKTCIDSTIQFHVQKDVHNRHESRVKTRNHNTAGDEWKEQASSTISKTENVSDACIQTTTKEPLNQRNLHSESKDRDGGDPVSSLDQPDYQTQRAKMRELAIQRAKQLQEEEEERTKEQKAKALAKLEELNKRTLTESSNKNEILVLQPDTVHDNMDSKVGTTVNCPVLSDVTLQPCAGDSCNTERTGKLQKNGTGENTTEDSVFIQNSDSGSVLDKSGEPTVMQNSNLSHSNIGGDLDSMRNLDSSNDNSGHSTLASPRIHGSGSNKDSQVVSHNSSASNDPNASLYSKKVNVQDITKQKQIQMVHRKKQSTQQDFEKPISPLESDPNKVQEFNRRHGTTADALTSNSNEISDNLATNRRKHNRGSRYKHKPDDSLHISTLPPILNNEGILKNPLESGILKFTESVSEAVPVNNHVSEETLVVQQSREIHVSSSQGFSQGAGGNGKAVSQWKPHPPRRIRSVQNRPADKIHGSEAVWAPVKQLNKVEASEAVAYNENTETSDHSLEKNAKDVQSNMKSKRAEMERYVPKVIAKELSRQGSTHQPSDDQAAANKPISNIEPTKSLAEVPLEHNNWEHDKPIKHGKNHTSWRQRSSYEGSSPDAIETVPKSFKEKQLTKPDCSSSQLINSNDAQVLDNANISCSDSVVVSTGAKRTMKAKRQGNKVHKIVSNDSVSDNKNTSRGVTNKSDNQSPTSEWSLDAQRSFKNETRHVGELARSQWKPKSHIQSSLTQDVNKVMAGQLPVQSGMHDKGSSMQAHHVENVDNKNNGNSGALVSEMISVHVEPKRNRKLTAASFKDQIASENQDSFRMAEQDPENTAPDSGQGPSGMRRYGQKNGRSNHFEGGRGLGQDTGKQNFPTKSDRQRHHSHYGYQKVESHNLSTNSSQSNVALNENQKDAFRAAGPSYKGRGQNHFRRRDQSYVRNTGHSTRAGEIPGVGE